MPSSRRSRPCASPTRTGAASSTAGISSRPTASRCSAGNGMSVPVEAAMADVPWFPTMFICAGNHPTQYGTKRVLSWLRRLARHGAVLGAIDTGAFTLAAAGLLDGYQVTLHWEALAMFRDQYPEIAASEQLYVIDRDRITCAGGNADPRPDAASDRPAPWARARPDRRQRLRRPAHAPRRRAATPVGPAHFRRQPRALHPHPARDGGESRERRSRPASSPVAPASRSARWAASCATGSANRPCATT